MTNLLNALGIKSSLTTAYHPQANGQTERANQEVEKYLRLYVDRRQSDWNKHLPTAEFVINSRVHSAHDRSPFEVTYGYLPHFNIPIGTRSHIHPVALRIDDLKEVRADVEAALKLDKACQKEDYEAGKRTAHQFEVGDWVWLDGSDIKRKVPSRKLGDKQLGPYQVLERVGDLTYKLKLLDDMKRVHPVFHIDKLSPFKGNDINGLLPPPPEQVEIDGELEYEVDSILNSEWRAQGGCSKKRKLWYEVSWIGYDPSYNLWIPEDNLIETAKEKVDKYHQRYPEADRRISAAFTVCKGTIIIEDDEA